STVRGCTMDDYTFVEMEENPTDTTYLDSYPYLRHEEWNEPDEAWELTDSFIIEKRPAQINYAQDYQEQQSAVRTYALNITDWNVGSNPFSYLEAVVTIDGETKKVGLCGDPDTWLDIWVEACNEGTGGIFPFEVDEEIVEIKIKLVDRDKLSDDDVFLKMTLELDPTTDTFVYQDETYGLGRKCAETDSGWEVCFDFDVEPVVPPPPVVSNVCVEWNAQLAGGVGEDDFTGKHIQSVPASFAYVSFDINGGEENYPKWHHYYPLNENGCIPWQYAPNAKHFMPKDSAEDVTMEMKIIGVLGYDSEEELPDAKRWRIHDKNYDGVTPDNYYSATPKTFMIDYVTSIDSSSSFDTENIVFSVNYNNEFTKVAASISHILKKHYDGIDLGLENLQKDVVIYPRARHVDWVVDPVNGNYQVYIPLNSAQTERGPFEEGAVLLRGDMDIPFGDASRKFSMTHEIGHSIHTNLLEGVLRSITTQSIQITSQWGVTEFVRASPAVPSECKCVIKSSSGETTSSHCMQTLMSTNEAVREGFAYFYSAKIWNNPQEEDCYISYAKWMYVPNCPPGTMDCEEENCVECDDDDAACSFAKKPFCFDAAKWMQDNPEQVGSEMDREFSGDTDVSEEDRPFAPLAGWKVVQPPVPLSCSLVGDDSAQAWNLWRNQYCLEQDSPPPLVFDTDSDTDSETDAYSADLVHFVTEIDYTKFFWAVNTAGNENERWSIDELITMMNAATNGVVSAFEYSKMLDAVKTLHGETSSQTAQFIQFARDAGIDLNLGD
ncbi:MAG: hypothetical protein JXX29_19945, partial [Deltaproteobacteria bacterium]|nr:hypothetical protein [Deltaproteobacteria bacterium]